MHSPFASRVALFKAFDLPGFASSNPRIGSRPSNDRTTSSVASVQLLFTTNTSQFTPAGITSPVIASRPCRSNAHRFHVHTPIDTFIRASIPPFQSEAAPHGHGRERILIELHLVQTFAMCTRIVSAFLPQTLRSGTATGGSPGTRGRSPAA